MSDERPRTPKGSKRERVKGFAKQFLGGLRGTPSSSSSLQPCSSSADRTTSGLEPPSASSGEQGLIPRPVRNDEEPSMSTLDTSSASRSPLPPVQGPEEPPYHNYGTVNNIGKVGNSFSGTNFGTFIQNSNEEPNWLDALHSRLKISAKADHRYYPGGDEQALRRSGCTPGTRIRIIEAIIAWATNASASSEIIYWLSGPGGAGKSTIAYTIAHLFESMMTRGDGATILGGSFFCSRHSAETRTASAIVRTIVYQLALRSEAFKMALKEHGRFETVDHSPKAQFKGLLVEPWRQSAEGRLAENLPCFVLPIDALDELDGAGGGELLGALFDVVSNHDLSGLKFLVTSRAEPALVRRIESFHKKQVCRLEEVPIEESSADIKLYFKEHLDECATDAQIGQLVSDAAGLFIYAATVVEYTKGRELEEQVEILAQILTLSRSPSYRPSPGATALLDDLYLHILETSLVDPRDRKDAKMSNNCLSILHTFLCTTERTSPSVAVGLLNAGDRGDAPPTSNGVANGVLRRLHAVLYTKDGNVMSYHKSFSDFILDEQRSHRYYCNQGQHHRLLLNGCFGVMKKELRFNIAGIPTSYKLDRDNAMLPESIRKNISSLLHYACRSWSSHFSPITPGEPCDPLLGVLGAFLQLPVLFWIEAMNLLQQRSRCEGMLLEVRKWVVQCKDVSQLVNDLGDATAFALYFSAHGASRSTPHLYLSSLATFPRTSSLCQEWRRHFRGIPAFTKAHGTSGQSLLFSIEVGIAVDAVAVSADGKHLAVVGLGSLGHLISVRALASGEELKVLKGHTKWVTSIAYSPDGLHIVSGSYDTSVRVWDALTGGELHALEGHTGPVDAVACSPDGARIASGSHDGSVRVWDIFTAQQLKILEGHTGPVSPVVYSQNGAQIISVSDDCTLRVWDAVTGEALQILGGHSEFIHSAAYLPHSNGVLSASFNGTVRMWDVSMGKELAVPKSFTQEVTALACSPDGNHILSGMDDFSVLLWDLNTGEDLMLFEGHTNTVRQVAFLPDSSRFVSASDDRSIRVWDLSAGQEPKEADSRHHYSPVHAVAFSPDGIHVVSGSSDGSLRVWDTSTGEEVRIQGLTRAITSVAYSAKGTRIASGSWDKTVRVREVSTSDEAHVFEGHAESVHSVAWSPDGAYVASGSEDELVRVWDIVAGNEVHIFEGHTGRVWSVAYSPCGAYIASGSEDASVRIWDVSTEKVLVVLEGHSQAVRSVAYSPEGECVASGSGDETVRVWDVATGRELRVLSGHTPYVTSVVYSPDGMRIASGSLDRSVRIWDAFTGEQLEVLQGHLGSVNSVAYSLDGRHIASASSDGSIRLWTPSTGNSLPRYIRETTEDMELTGWLLSPLDHSIYLMFVPFSENIPDDSNTATFPRSLLPIVDFVNAKLGERWIECYTPIQ